MSEENVNILRQGYDAFNRGDIDAVMGLMDPEIEWQEPDVEGMPARGTHHGPEAVANNVFGSIAGNWDGFQAVPEEFLDAGDRVIVLGRFQGTGKATGSTADAPYAHVWTLRDGKAVHHRNCTTATMWTRPSSCSRSGKTLSRGPGSFLGGLGPSSCPYSPECVEGLFPELPAEGVLGSSAIQMF